jgi:type I restriction enzyme M protein
MAIKKSELYSSLWKSCDELRGGMDASQYKDYVLSLLFVKYVSDKYAGKPHALIEIPEGGGFGDMVALKGKKEIGDGINKVIAKLAEANDLKGVIDVADFNNADKLGRGQEMQDRLTNLVAIFEDPSLDFSKNRAEGDDLLGDAYEYLMRHFATEAGKSKGQFYTPAEVSRVMAKVIGINQAQRPDQTAYDPTGGSGSLVLKAADEAEHGVTIYVQEMDNATAALAKMNMILHNHPTAEIWRGNTLADPHYLDAAGNLKTFDFVVANVPFSMKAWSTGFDPANDRFGRFSDGVPPAKNGDYAFLLHIIRSLKSTGKGAVILPHGVLFRGNTEAEIRKNLVKKGYIKGIIGLPPNLFYGTGIPACILVLDKEGAAGRQGIFMIDASKGFLKDGNKNRLRHQDIHKIVDVFTKGLDLPGYARLVSIAEIAEKNDYNLNLPRYIDSSATEDAQDIAAHLLGGIPQRDIDALAPYWQAFPALKALLFAESERAGYLTLQIAAAPIKATIYHHAEFVAYADTVMARFAEWQSRTAALLKTITVGVKPKQVIETIAEDLLQSFANLPLLDNYDLYQALMDYWSQTMQDDLYLLASEGWDAANRLRPLTGDKEKKEKADLELGKARFKADLIPPALIVAHYFGDAQRALALLQADKEALTRQREELEEEHGGDEGLLADAKNEKEKLTRLSVQARLKALLAAPAEPEEEAQAERALLARLLDLIDREAAAATALKTATSRLDHLVAAHYPKLSEAAVKTLVVEDKWLATLHTALHNEVERTAQTLAHRVQELADRYATPLPQIDDQVADLAAKVNRHLERMGFAWQ